MNLGLQLQGVQRQGDPWGLLALSLAEETQTLGPWKRICFKGTGEK